MKRRRYTLPAIVLALCLVGAGSAVALRKSSSLLPSLTHGCTAKPARYYRGSSSILEQRDLTCMAKGTIQEFDEAIRRLPNKSQTLYTQEDSTGTVYTLTDSKSEFSVTFTLDTSEQNVEYLIESSLIPANPIAAFVADLSGRVQSFGSP